jgi:hypothetical protein
MSREKLTTETAPPQAKVEDLLSMKEPSSFEIELRSSCCPVAIVYGFVCILRIGSELLSILMEHMEYICGAFMCASALAPRQNTRYFT